MRGMLFANLTPDWQIAIHNFGVAVPHAHHHQIGDKRQNFKNLEIVQFVATALKSIPKLVEMQSLGAKCCKLCTI
jgi:hypothetical protein